MLDDLERQFPRAEITSPAVRSRGDDGPETIDIFMTRVLGSIDRYWSRTFEAADLPEPRVGFVPVPPGARLNTACGIPAGDAAALYCPSDDTIYVAQVFAADLLRGVARGLPGERTGYGRAAGDFAVAYVLAHEYAHDLQQELGVFDNGVGASAKPYELQADCLAGTWAFSGHLGVLGLRGGPARAGRHRGGDECRARRRRLRRRQCAAPRHAAGAPRRTAHRLQQRRADALRPLPARVLMRWRRLRHEIEPWLHEPRW